MFGTEDIQTNLTMTYLKHYIYLRRNRNLNLNLESFIRYVKYHFEAQKRIAIKNEKLVHFEKQWKFLKLFADT